MMSIFNKTGYLRALFILLPFGIVFFLFGIKGLLEKEEHLIPYNGEINDIRIRQHYIEYLKKYKRSFLVKLQSSDNLFHTHFPREIDVLKSNLNVGDTIKLWTKKNSLEIVKLQCGEELLVPFNPTTWMDVLILVIGIVFTTLSVAYIIKHPEDLWGGDKEKMKRWWNGKNR